MEFLDKDIEQIEDKGITLDQIKSQIARLKNGMSYSHLEAAATIKNGVAYYNDTERQNFIRLYDTKKDELAITKFVPASGAATRMFKFLFEFLKTFNPAKESITDYSDRQNDDLIIPFIDNFELFPFYNDVILYAKRVNPDFDSLSKEEKCFQFVKIMLDNKGLNYSSFPKGLLPFHKYADKVKTAFEEHLIESTLYATSNGVANLHFTVSQKHHHYFLDLLNKVKDPLEQKTNTTFNVSFSFQKEATDTVALVADNKIYRDKENNILFRPGGHGALIENLNDLNSDLIFIKNIDNIVVLDKNIAVSNYKKLLGGILLDVQEKVFAYLYKLDEGNLSELDFKEIGGFLKSKLNIVVPLNFDNFSFDEKTTILREKLNRPIRVCGMVKNEGEPGGGPFWVKDDRGNSSLQIVEFAQINFSKKDQQELVYKATHFNPADLVCGVKNYKGEKFNLLDFVDDEAAFITVKTQNGTDIKVLELPGLWNGSMAYWNSIFVEVPLETFNPVKTVNDLLKPAHQVL